MDEGYGRDRLGANKKKEVTKKQKKVHEGAPPTGSSLCRVYSMLSMAVTPLRLRSNFIKQKKTSFLF
jgi:hypothetical protein